MEMRTTHSGRIEEKEKGGKKKETEREVCCFAELCRLTKCVDLERFAKTFLFIHN